MWPIGTAAPDFEGWALVNAEFKKIKLSDYRGKYVVLFFYQRNFTHLCPSDITAFEERVKEFERIGCQVIGCSTDSRFGHFAWVYQPRKDDGLGEVKFPLLADPTYQISRSYGVLNEDRGFAYGATFIIDAKGVLRQLTINDHQVGRNVDESLRLVKAFQLVDQQGEVCPANWRPGSLTIKPVLKKPEPKQAVES